MPLNALGESYFIIVDIPGLDTNGTYHKVITAGTPQFDNLDYVADSAKITPGLFIGIQKVSINNTEIKMYPNPTNGIIYFESDLLSDDEINISFTDVLGKEILKSSALIPDKKFQMDLSSFNSGIYFMSIKAGNEQRRIKVILTK